jgi:rfaE bifunctional protein nucleotidyltransferase chain/domain/rfaE bifunctional protein kinase chain/domain
MVWLGDHGDQRDFADVGGNGDLADVVARWRGSRVVVLGDSFVDEWWYGEPERLSREAPVPVIALDRVQRAPGGAANTAVNLAALGARPVLVTPISDDPDGAWLRRCLTDAGVAVRSVPLRTDGTPVKRRMVANGQIVLRVDSHGGDLTPDATDLVAATETALRGEPVAVVACDYSLGALDDTFLAWLRQRRDSLPVLAVDAHHLQRWRDLRPTLVKPNFAEMAELLAPDHRLPDGPVRVSTVESQAKLILDRTGAHIAAVTLDIDGALVLDGQTSAVRTATVGAPASHAVGAGDAYLAALTLAVANGAPLRDAATLAQRAATASIQGPRTCVTRLEDIVADRTADLAPSSADHDVASVLARVRAARARGARLVFTNGCFDVLHHGHVGFLRQARALGDLLVVGLNSDASVARLKGPDRPVNSVEDRLAVLSALSCVDYVIVFEENSPEWLIKELRPDIYVKGGDYHGDLLPEADLVRRLGGEVRILDYLPDRSTSSIIERIRSRAMPIVPES